MPPVDRRAGLVVLAAVVCIAAIVVVLAWAPYWFPRTPGLDQPSEARWLSQEVGRNRTAMLAVMGGGLAAVGAWLTWLNVKVSRRGQLTDRFAKSIELMAHKSEAVRLGGVYGLHAIARESPEDRQSARNVLRFHAEHFGADVADGSAALDVLDNLEPDSNASQVANSVEASLARMRVLTLAVRGTLVSVAIAAAALPIYVSSQVANKLPNSARVDLNLPLAIVATLALGGLVLSSFRGRSQRATIRNLRRRTELLERPIIIARENRFADFGTKLEQARVAAGITRLALSAQIGKDPKTVARYVSGASIPSREVVEKWQRLCETEDLLKAFDGLSLT